MAPHPQVTQLLDMLAALDGPALHEMDPVDARVTFAAMGAMNPPTETPASTHDVEIEGPDATFGARLYLPEGDAPHAALVWYHGGGWVIGDLETADATARTLCVKGGVAVLSVDYRLAPEHRFPAAVTDAVAALDWARSGGDGSLDGSRIAVGGDSAGGNLAAVVARHARDAGIDLAHQLLVYPVTDCTRSSESYRENADGFFLTADGMKWFCEHYLGDADPTDPVASPLHATDHAGLAPATVITAEYDPLRDEGEAYADAMRNAGVAVDAKRYDGQIHGFFGLHALLDDANTALAETSATLAAALH
jgi:acetyl esterase